MFLRNFFYCSVLDHVFTKTDFDGLNWKARCAFMINFVVVVVSVFINSKRRCVCETVQVRLIRSLSLRLLLIFIYFVQILSFSCWEQYCDLCYTNSYSIVSEAAKRKQQATKKYNRYTYFYYIRTHTTYVFAFCFNFFS